MSSVTGLRRSSGEEHDNPLHHMDRRAWWSMIHGVAKQSDTTEVTWYIWLNYLPYAVVVLLEDYFDN